MNPNDINNIIGNENFTEFMHRAIASCHHEGDLNTLKKIALNDNLKYPNRVCALDSMIILYAQRQLPRYQLTELIEEILQTKSPDFISETVKMCHDFLHPYEVMPYIREVNKKGLIEDKDLKASEETNKHYSIEEAENRLKKSNYYAFLDYILLEIIGVIKELSKLKTDN